jgi:hypothetical protein
MTTRKDLAQRLAELPAFNLRFGSRVDIFNLPTDDRDLIVSSLREAEDLSDQSQNLAMEFEKLRERILALTAERDDIGSRLLAARGESAETDEQRRTLAAENARLEETCRSLVAERQSLEQKILSLTAENSAIVERQAPLVADHARLAEEKRSLTASLDGAVDLLIRLVNGEADVAAAASFVQSRFPGKAPGLRPVAARSEWQPIATAPRDNSPVNLIGRAPAGRWSAPVASRRNMVSADAGVDQWLDWPHPFEPSHWCPIPAAPGAADASASRDAGVAPPRPLGEPRWSSEDLRITTTANRR